MAAPERSSSAADSLEEVLGRALGLGGAPPPLGGGGEAAGGAPRRPARPRRGLAAVPGRGRRHLVAGAAVCAALAVALVAVVLLEGPAAVAPPTPDATGASGTSEEASAVDPGGPDDVPPLTGAPLTERIPAELARVCRPATALDPDAVEGLVCSPGAPVIRLEYLRYQDPATFTARFAAAVTDLPRPTGPPVCPSGGSEHRSWSRPDAPTETVGDYACRVGEETISIVWTVGGDLVARAEAEAEDAGALYAWWRSSDAAL